MFHGKRPRTGLYNSGVPRLAECLRKSPNVNSRDSALLLGIGRRRLANVVLVFRLLSYMFIWFGYQGGF